MDRNPLSLESLIPTLQLAMGQVILVSVVGIHAECVEYNPHTRRYVSEPRVTLTSE